MLQMITSWAMPELTTYNKTLKVRSGPRTCVFSTVKFDYNNLHNYYRKVYNKLRSIEYLYRTLIN